MSSDIDWREAYLRMMDERNYERGVNADKFDEGAAYGRAEGERAATERIVDELTKIGTAKLTHPSLRDWITAPGGIIDTIKLLQRGEHKEAIHE